MTGNDDDLPAEAAGADHLFAAMVKHADPALSKQYVQKGKQLDQERRRNYVGNVHNPEGYVFSDYDSHTKRLLEELHNSMLLIEADVISKLCNGLLTVWARVGSPLAPWRRIPASAWNTLRFHEPKKGTAIGPNIALFDLRMGVPVKIQILTPSPQAVNDDHITTGMPGRRPKGAEIIKAELTRRIAAKELEVSLAAQSRALADWYHEIYPMNDSPTPKVIENNLREDFKKARQP